ncbi:hypothetical protein OHA40_08050 [Nocardia sp. NBC_00508]|uniref:hypothetical protein n=1 Tax=Nocardia sp. NBC_00508 TaxID=2975992 RepID=UPI002E81F67F|nr:hypothetical protein [Nocardia sp. NBC_00508]WUD68058.1 hypothetical protein OHA40_08050 [Nocardia sp. NBC_00508]
MTSIFGVFRAARRGAVLGTATEGVFRAGSRGDASTIAAPHAWEHSHRLRQNVFRYSRFGPQRHGGFDRFLVGVIYLTSESMRAFPEATWILLRLLLIPRRRCAADRTCRR